MNYKGLTEKEVEESRSKYGSNALTEIPPEPLWKKILKGFKDPMIMILLAALLIQAVLFVFGEAEWFEPVGILAAILIANGVASVSENKQEHKASALKAETAARESAKVIRGGILSEIHVSEIVTGDILFVQAGDKIPADGVVIEGLIKADQSALNGETEEAQKTVCPEGHKYNTKDLLDPCYAYRGTVVVAGEGYIEVKTVGDKTLFGELALEVQENTRETPLQVKLGKLAKQISCFGYIGAIAIIAGILIKTLVSGNIPSDVYEWIKLIINAVTVAVTVIVCAVPEGLPMLTSILLSFQSMKMAKDNVLVRKINGLETSGSLSILFSDKTGTITEGKLSVTEFACGDASTFEHFKDISDKLSCDIVYALGVNNSANISGEKVIGGNSTDRALMQYLLTEKIIPDKNGLVSFSAFDSNKKTSSVTIKKDGKVLTYIKGAPEKIIDRCTFYIDVNGNRIKLEDKNKLTNYIDTCASRSMRLLAAAVGEGEEPENELTLVCIVSIRDNVRKEAVKAIEEVQSAGVQVVMVTGDRKETAVAIAKESGLLKENDIAVTSHEMADMSDNELKEIMPRLRVVSRALPTDKSRLVRIAQEMDHVVGMTGDGVNDSPALKKADVGFAMGSGTEVAKEAGDIIITDDNFSSIEKAILYGRTIFKSIRKFLIFQLTVNVAAVLICFIGPLMGENVVLTVIQLLLINLAMDTLAAIAFGGEPALHEYLKEPPVRRKESIITKTMFAQVIITALYITIVCLSLLYFSPLKGMIGNTDMTYLKSALFATFMMAITFNGFNARTSGLNIFRNIGQNKNFIIIMLSLLIMQFVFITFGGEALSVEPLGIKTWGICILLAVLVIPVDMIRKVLMNR